MTTRLRGAATAIAAAVLVSAAAGCGAERPAASAPPTTAVSLAPRIPVGATIRIVGPDGSGLAVWHPKTLADAVAGSDAVAVATVRSVRDGARIEGLPSQPGGDAPPALPAVAVTLDVERTITRGGWARDLPAAPTLYVLEPEDGAPLGLETGGRYVFFLAERDQVVDGDDRAYNTAWAGGYTEVDGDRLEGPAGGRPGTAVLPSGSIDDLASTAKQIDADRKLATAPVTASPNPLLATRAAARERFNFDPKDPSR